ncbi:MAG: BTAD domain-containing putative transcriptional regulator [Paracoccaceae bacterium]|nr:BTAD domain-containing putative transcriptional regulator [Paracoccaceae bacterium]
MKLNVQMLGQFVVRLGNSDVPVAFPRHKAAALFAILASAPGKQYSRETLADLLWGRRGDAAARNNLRQTLFLIRRVLPEYSGLLASPESVGLDRTTVVTDVDEFETKANGETAVELEAAVSLYAGDFLQSFYVREGSFEEWRTRTAERLSDICLSVHERLMLSYADQKRHSEAIRLATRALRIDPFHEAAHETLVVSNAAQGRVTSARQLYDRFANLLSAELGLTPSRPLHDLMHAGQSIRRDSKVSEGGAASPALGAALTEIPIAVVLPFESSGPSSSDVARALVPNLIGGIGGALPLPVVGTGQVSGSEADNALSPDQVSRSGARYVVQGHVWSWGDQWRVDYRVVDAVTDRQLISGSSEHTGESPFRVVDVLGARIAASTVSAIELSERKRLGMGAAVPLDAWDSICRGLALLDQLSCKTILSAQESFREAMEISPNNARALAGLSQAILQEGICHVGRTREETYSEALRLAHRACALDQHDPFVNLSLGKALHRAERFEEALEPLQKALSIVPDNPDVCGTLGNLLSFMGQPKRGITFIQTSLKSTDAFLAPMARSYLQMGDYKEARAWSERALAAHPENSWAYVLLGSSLGHLGEKGEAYRALNKCEEIHSGRVIAEFETSPSQYGNPHDHDHVLAGVELSGWRH